MNLLSAFRWQDALDVLIVSYLTYRLYLWLRYTKAFQALLGLGFLGVLYLVSRRIDLVATTWLFEELWAVLVILLIILFQSDIQQALSRANPIQFLIGAPPAPGVAELSAVARAVFSLAERRVGALIVFERKNALEGHVLEGTTVEGRLSPELLGTIFHPGAPLHDGAIIVRGGRIRRAGCYLPLAPDADLPSSYGTRHRAGLGITRETDAVSVIASEERGTVALAYDGRIGEVLSADTLTERLQNLLTPAPLRHTTLPRLRRPFARLGTKLAVLGFVSLVWYFLVFGQRLVTSVTVPVEYRNVAESLVLSGRPATSLEVRLRGTRAALSGVNPESLRATVDLGATERGTNFVAVGREDVNVPAGVELVGTEPAGLRLTLERVQRLRVRVRARLRGEPARGYAVAAVTVVPGTVEVLGPESAVANLQAVYTEPVDLTGAQESFNRAVPLALFPERLALADGKPTSVEVRVTLRRTAS